MEQAIMRFPEGFLWGTATSSHQVEGNNKNNDWWEWEKEPGHILTHLAAVHRAMQEGVPVKGYFHWSLVDNFEWAEGWTLRFGLIALDVETQERTVRRGGQLYGEICQAGAITQDMVRRYAPEVLDKIFPG